jgi:hypothetical protein
MKFLNIFYQISKHLIALPDLCSRVFNCKLKKLLKDLKSGKAFGPIVGVVHVVEFQKRGLPYAHILLILESQISAEDFDK